MITNFIIMLFKILIFLLIEGAIIFLWCLSGYSYFILIFVIFFSLIISVKLWVAIDNYDTTYAKTPSCIKCKNNKELSPVFWPYNNNKNAYPDVRYWQCLSGHRYKLKNRLCFKIMSDNTVQLIMKRKFLSSKWNNVQDFKNNRRKSV